MKKRLLSLTLIFCMLLTFLPMTSLAAIDTDYGVKIVIKVDESYEYNGQNTLLVEFQIKTGEKKIATAQGVNLALDLSVFDVIYSTDSFQSYADYSNSLPVTPVDLANYTVINKMDSWTTNLYAGKTSNTAFIRMQVSRGTDALWTGLQLADYTTVESFRIGLSEGKKITDVSASAIRLTTPAEFVASGASFIASVTDGNTNVATHYADSARDTLARPEVTASGFTFAKPAIEGTVSITGAAKYDQTLTAVTSDITSSEPGALSYKWYRGDAEISGATGETYTLVAEDIGKSIKVEVTATNYSGSLTSAATAAVAKADGPAAPAAPTVTKTHNAVTVSSQNTAYEYACVAKDTALTEDDWKTSGSFTGLSANTAYDVYARVAATDTREASAASAKLEITTEKTPIPDDAKGTLAGYSGTYDGAAHDAIAGAPGSGYTATYSTSQDGQYTGAIPQVADVSDSKTVYVKLSKSDYEDKVFTFTASISPKALVDGDFTMNANPTYTGSAISAPVTSKLTNADYTVGGTSTLTDVSASNVTITFTGKDNYSGVINKAWNLTPKDVTITGVTAGNKSYDGTTAATASGTAAVSGKIGSDDVTVTAGTAAFADQYVGTGKTVTFSGYSLGGAKAGNYNLTAQPADTTANITAVADPATITATATVTKGENTVNLSSNVSNNKGTVTYAITGALTGCSVDASTGAFTSGNTTGDCTVTVTVAAKNAGGTADNEYTGKTAAITVTVQDKATATLSGVTQSGCTFGDTLAAPVYTAPDGTKTTTVTYAGTLRKDSSSYSSTTKPTEAGEYTVVVKCETATHIYTSAAVSFTIAPKPITGATVTLGTALTYTGSSQTQNVASVMLGGTDILTSCNVTGNTSTAAGQYTLTVTAKAESNYTGSADKVFHIQKKAITPTVAVTGGPYVFTGSAITPTYTVKDGATALASTDFTAVVSDNLNAGSGKITVTEKATGNYTFTEKQQTFAISKAAAQTLPNITGSQKYTVTTEQIRAIDRGGMPDDAGTLSYSIGGTANVTGNPLPTVEFSVEPSGNVKYTITNGVAGNTITLPIKITSQNYDDSVVKVVITLTDRDAPTVSANNITVTYTGAAVPASSITGTATFNSVAVPGTWSWKDASVITTVAHSGEKTVVFTPTDAINYKPVETTLTLTISKAAPTGAPTYTAISTAGKTLADAALKVGTIKPTGGTIKWNDVETTAVSVNTAYGWTYTPADIANYNVLTGSITPYYVAPPSGGGGVSSYTLTFDVNGGGKLDAVTKNSGETVELAEYKPTRDGYTFVGWYSDKELTKAVTTVELTADTTVYAKWAKVLPFTDVKDGDYFKAAVLWAVENGVTEGTSPTTFSPDGICTRAQAVTFLWRAMGEPTPTATSTPFTDVKADAYYYNAVLWAVEKGVTIGTSATTFSPDDTVTRAQVVTMLWRAAGKPAQTAANPFADVESGAYYENAVLWAVAESITEGTSAITFDPADGCVRAQIVTFLWRDLGK